MPIVQDEQKEKRPGMFLKLEDKSKLVIYSHLYKLNTHFLKADKISVICAKPNECFFCSQKQKARTEYYYFSKVNDEEGVVRVPASVFFALNEQERVLETDKRKYIWVISKKGSGLETEYGVARGDEAGTPSISLEDATKKLTEKLDKYNITLEDKYEAISGEIPGQPVKGKQPSKPMNENVEPSDIPF